MLDEANASFINVVVTLIRWVVYITIAMIVMGVAWNALAWLWKYIRPVTDKNELEKARRHMRDLGY